MSSTSDEGKRKRAHIPYLTSRPLSCGRDVVAELENPASLGTIGIGSVEVAEGASKERERKGGGKQ
jgi:hypothetical protein